MPWSSLKQSPLAPRPPKDCKDGRFALGSGCKAGGRGGSRNICGWGGCLEGGKAEEVGSEGVFVDVGVESRAEVMDPSVVGSEESRGKMVEGSRQYGGASVAGREVLGPVSKVACWVSQGKGGLEVVALRERSERSARLKFCKATLSSVCSHATVTPNLSNAPCSTFLHWLLLLNLHTHRNRLPPPRLNRHLDPPFSIGFSFSLTETSCIPTVNSTGG